MGAAEPAFITEDHVEAVAQVGKGVLRGALVVIHHGAEHRAAALQLDAGVIGIGQPAVHVLRAEGYRKLHIGLVLRVAQLLERVLVPK